MWKIFDGLMRLISSLIGLAMIAMGIVWMLQGLNLAFRGDMHWTLYGALLVLAGCGQLLWSNMRVRPH